MATFANITRRCALKLFPAAATAAVVPVFALAASEPMSVEEAMKFHATELFKAAGSLGRDQFVFLIPRHNGDVLLSAGYYRDGEDPEAEEVKPSGYTVVLDGVTA